MSRTRQGLLALIFAIFLVSAFTLRTTHIRARETAGVDEPSSGLVTEITTFRHIDVDDAKAAAAGELGALRKGAGW